LRQSISLWSRRLRKGLYQRRAVPIDQSGHDYLRVERPAFRADNVTILFVEHDMEIVSRYTQRILAFYEGRIIADGAPQTVLNDADVRKFVTGKMHAPATGGAMHAANGQPAHMRAFKVLPNTRAGDNGGVHTNSGIHNKAAIAQEDAPALTGRVTFLGHVLGNGRLSHRKSKFEQFAMNARRTPKHVFNAHPSDQGA
jgi:ABC-type sulfate/molybdate transport systems ATPase subunit